MTATGNSVGLRRYVRCLPPLLAVAAFTGCASRTGVEVPMAQQLSAEVRAILGTSRPSLDYHRERSRLQEMGPDLDVILIGLIGDTRARSEARADALVLLADRGSPLALPTLESALQSRNERLRSAAVLGLNRLAATTPSAIALIRDATRDPSRTVRLNALQSLDIREVETIRDVLGFERDREVRLVALQLLALAEARGAALAADFRGSLRTVAGEGEPQVVFRPFTMDSVAGVARGDLRVELADQRDIPLASSAMVVGNVVPAFFSTDRSSLVFESAGRIGVLNIGSRSIRIVGDGIAPRPIPFTHAFVFLREVSVDPTPGPDGTRIVYDAYMGTFGGDAVERVGRVSAWSRPDVHGGASPVRWMVVDEVSDGFQLRGENMQTMQLPAPVWTPVSPNSRMTSGSGN